jgi:hypothetical protein
MKIINDRGIFVYLKLSSFLEKLAFKAKQKALYFELKHFIAKKQSYFLKIRKWQRCIGKTYTLIQLAHKYNATIVVPNYNCGKNIKTMSKNIFKKDINVIVVNECLRGKRYNIVLLEEGIKKDYISEILIPVSKCVVGYIN